MPACSKLEAITRLNILGSSVSDHTHNPMVFAKFWGESPATVDYLDHSAILISCPDHDLGAIEDRKTEGAKIVGKFNSWTLLQMPEQQN